MPGMMTMDKDGFARGNYMDLQLQCKLTLEPIKDDQQRGANTTLPTHNVYVDVGGGPILIGACWTKKVNKAGSNMNGKTLYSIELDDPSFSRVLRLTAWPTKDPDHFEIRFNRDDRQQAAA